MKHLLIIIIILLIPCLAFGQWGTKPPTTTPVTGAVIVTGTVDATIDSADTRKLISVDVLPAITGAVDATIDSADTRKLISVDVMPAITGNVGLNNFADMMPIQRDSTTTSASSGLDTITVVMTTGVWFEHSNGFYRFGFSPDIDCDSTLVHYRFTRNGSGETRWFPMSVDSVSIDGNATGYVSTNTLVKYWAGKKYWALLYDPSSTNPMSYLPSELEEIEFRFINTGYDAVTYVTKFKWQEN